MLNKMLLLFCTATVLVACKKTDTTPPASDPIPYPVAALYQYNVLPSATSSAITAFNNEHYVCLDTRVILKNKLFVFFPGTSATPSLYQGIIQKAAALGYHAIGLMYTNNSDLYVASASSPDNNQFGLCRSEIFNGTDVTTGVTVNTDNCIKNRLVKLLQYLQQQTPWQNWQQFLNGTTDVNWSKCLLGGHSQGGGHAAYIGKQVSVDRVVVFSSIDWNGLLNKSANWVTTAGLTPAGKYYTFIHPSDEIFNWNNARQQYTDAGIPGLPVNIDSVAAPYNSSHNLYTRAAPALAIIVPNHNVTCLDLYTPKNGIGQLSSSFTTAWEYLLDK
jgi:hypothetical protein